MVSKYIILRTKMRRGKGYRSSRSKKSRKRPVNASHFNKIITPTQDPSYHSKVNEQDLPYYGQFKQEDDYNLEELEEIFHKLLGEEIPKNETLEEQVVRYNVYAEYEAMTPRVDRLNNYDKARYLILQGIIKMVKFDPKNGDKPNIMTAEQELYWEDLEDNIKEGGGLLYREGGKSHICGTRDDLVWSFVPKSIRHKISMLFDEITME